MSFAIFTPEAFPRCLDFPPFFLLFVVNRIIYIYTMYLSFLKIRRTIFVAGYVYLCVCCVVCGWTCTSELSLFFLSSFQKMMVKSGALCVAIKKSRHDVAASVPGFFKISSKLLFIRTPTFRKRPQKPSRRKFKEDFVRRYIIFEMLP